MAKRKGKGTAAKGSSAPGSVQNGVITPELPPRDDDMSDDEYARLCKDWKTWTPEERFEYGTGLTVAECVEAHEKAQRRKPLGDVFEQPKALMDNDLPPALMKALLYGEDSVDGISLPKDLNLIAGFIARHHLHRIENVASVYPHIVQKYCWNLDDAKQSAASMSLMAAVRSGFTMALMLYANELKDLPKASAILESVKKRAAKMNAAKRQKRRKCGGKMMTLDERDAAIVAEFPELKKRLGSMDAQQHLADKYGPLTREMVGVIIRKAKRQNSE